MIEPVPLAHPPRASLTFRVGVVGHRPNRLPRDEAYLQTLRRRISVVLESAKATVEARAAATNEDRAAAIAGAHIVLATGAAGITLLQSSQWQQHPTLELVADANASPPAGIEGVAMADRGTESHGKILFGPLGFGALKLALHRACIARLFDQNDLVLDAEEIYALAKTMVGKTAS